MNADTVEFDDSVGVYRIRTAAGVVLGSEFGGSPCAFESPGDAQDMIERRADLAEASRQALRGGTRLAAR